MTSNVVRGTVAHRRLQPFDYRFEHRTTAWLVDAADPEAAFPRWLRPFLRIRSRDHLGDGDGPLITKLRSWLAEHDVTWSAHTVRVLVNARTCGHVFDPLTTYFCFDPSGRLEGILAEVHNTYGGQHCYALPAPRARVDKAFYVSPFFEVQGSYEMRARLSEDDVAVSISLTQDGAKVFTGSVHGALAPATESAVVRAFLRDPFASQRVSLLIRWHGVRLWLRRLPVVPRDRRTAASEDHSAEAA